jgi:guanine deaminase
MHEQYLRRAIRLAVENVGQGRGGPFGAVIVKDGAIIAEGANHVTTIPDPTAHAEVLAIREAARSLGTHDLKGCTIYSSCEPCPMCLGAIYWAHLDAVYFAATRDDAAASGFDDSFLYDEIPLPTDRRSKPAIMMDCAESSAPFAAWRISPDRKLY